MQRAIPPGRQHRLRGLWINIRWRVVPVFLLLAVWAGTHPVAARQAPTDDFYRGKVLRIVVGSSAGGGYDKEARLLARYLPAHVPGNPAVHVDNVGGAGGLVAANLFARTVRPDGLTLGYFPSGAITAQALGNPAVQFDLRRFEMVGSPYRDHTVCVLANRTGVSTVQQWQASSRPLKLGATGRESSTYLLPAMLADALHLPIQIVAGYKGTAEVHLALVSGELDGVCLAWGGVRSAWSARDSVSVVVQAGTSPRPDLPDVPLASTFATTNDARAILGAWFDDLGSVSRLYVLPPGTPAALIDTLRLALQDTMHDPAYVRDAAASGVTVDPRSGQEVTDRVRAFLEPPPTLAARLRRAVAR